MNNFLDRILSIFAPHICKRCGKLGKTLCESCFFDIIDDLDEKCVACEADISPAIFAKSGNMCAKCSRILPFARVSVVGVRSGALLRLVDEYKYASERDSARVIARLLDEKLPEFSRKTVVSYITTSAPHIRERGFDHMELVAKHFAKIRKLKFAKTLARKSSDSQHDKNAAERQILAAKMFVISRKFARNVPENILLIDDIWTTGATAISAAKLLRENGVQRIELAIVARQIIGTHHKDLAKTVKM